MRFDVITILPMIFAGFRRFGVCGRALADGRAALKFGIPATMPTEFAVKWTIRLLAAAAEWC